MKAAAVAGVTGRGGGACYQGFVEDCGTVGEEGVAVGGRVAALNV
jgi:hypothetical protein